MKKILLVLRVSKEEQELKNSLAAQEEQAISYCKNKGYKIYKIIKDVESGLYNDRKGLIQLKEEVKNKNFDTLVAYELSRISRKQREVHELIDEMRKNNIEWEFIMQPELNTNSGLADLLLGFYTGLAAQESNQLSLRVKTRIRHNKQLGKYQGKPPFGYDLIDKKLVINEESSLIIKRIFDLFLSGVNRKQIAERLGKSQSSIHQFLENPCYKGYVVSGKWAKDKNTKKQTKNEVYEVYKGIHEPIISEKDFDTVQTLIEKIKIRYVKSTTDDRFLLSGIAYCIKCNRKLTGLARQYPHSYSKSYRCNNFYSHLKSINADELENSVIDTLLGYLETRFNFLDTFESQKKNNSKFLRALISKKDRVIETYQDGFITKAELNKKLLSIEKELANIGQENVVIEVPVSELKIRYTKLLKNFKQKTRLEQKNILVLIIDKVIVDENGDYELYFNM